MLELLTDFSVIKGKNSKCFSLFILYLGKKQKIVKTRFDSSQNVENFTHGEQKAALL